MDSTQGTDERGLGFERVVFFSDAVFAIAITLLVVDLRLPEVAEGAGEPNVADLLGAVAPRLLAYAVSFAVIGVYWMAHWRRFGLIVRVDERLMLLNLLLLAFVALMPFPTGVMSEHGDDPAAVLLYMAVVTAAGVTGSVSWWYAVRAGLVRTGLSAGYVRLTTLRGLAVPIVMVASLPLLLVDTDLVFLSWLAIIPVQSVIAHRLRETDGAPAA